MSNLHYYFVVALFKRFLLTAMIDNTKCYTHNTKSDPLQPDECRQLLIFLCVEKKWAHLLFIIFYFIYFNCLLFFSFN